MVNKEIIKKIQYLLKEDRYDIVLHAQLDIVKQGYNWSKDFIKNCLLNGKIFNGKELYPNEKERHKRYYCLHKYSILSSKLIIISFIIKKNLLIIHISPLNRGSKEGKIYYNS